MKTTDVNPSVDHTTPAEVTLAYDAIVALGDAGGLAVEAQRMREAFRVRSGTWGPEDAWFENRSRAFWDDALTTQGFADLARDRITPAQRAVAARFGRAHRGIFVVEEVDDRSARLLDLWSGAELLVRLLDETQALTLEHAEGAMDARVTAGAAGPELFVLPGAYHHPPDALEPANDVLAAAKERGMTKNDALDALLRMELVLRTSSRVKAAFAYRPESLEGARRRPGRTPEL